MAHFTYNLCIIKINECLVAKNLLTNVTKANKHSNVTTFVYALIGTYIVFKFVHLQFSYFTGIKLL